MQETQAKLKDQFTKIFKRFEKAKEKNLNMANIKKSLPKIDDTKETVYEPNNSMIIKEECENNEKHLEEKLKISQGNLGSWFDEDNKQSLNSQQLQFNEEELEQLAKQIFNNAATFIQKIWRGFYTRKILQYYFEMLEQEEIQLLSQQYQIPNTQLQKLNSVKVKSSDSYPPTPNKNLPLDFDENFIDIKNNQNITEIQQPQINKNWFNQQQTGEYQQNDQQISNLKISVISIEEQKSPNTLQEQLNKLKEEEIQKWNQMMQQLIKVENNTDIELKKQLINNIIEISEQNKQNLLGSQKQTSREISLNFQSQNQDMVNQIDDFQQQKLEVFDQIFENETSKQPDIVLQNEFSQQELIDKYHQHINIATQTSYDLSLSNPTPSSENVFPKENKLSPIDLIEKYEISLEKTFNKKIQQAIQNPVKDNKEIVIQNNQQFDDNTTQIFLILKQQEIYSQKSFTPLNSKSKFSSLESSNMFSGKNPDEDKQEDEKKQCGFFKKDPYTEFKDRKIKQLFHQENLQKLIDMRKISLENQEKNQIEALERMKNNVSHTIYQTNKNDFENWLNKEREQLQILENKLEISQNQHQKTQNDIVNSQTQNLSDQIPNQNNIKIIEQFELQEETYQNDQPNHLFLIDSQKNVKLVLEPMDFTNTGIQQQIQQIQDENIQIKQENNFKEIVESEEQQNIQEHQITQDHSFPPQEQIQNTLIEDLNEKWRTKKLVETRILQQIESQIIEDKSAVYGICTNQCSIMDYLTNLFHFIMGNYYVPLIFLVNHKEEFIHKINIPFGFSPIKRLKLIHGYDIQGDIPYQSEQYKFADYYTLPYILSEEIFNEFEQNIIGNGDNEKEQIIKEFEHIHNKSIFDSFNEALNLSRPFYSLGGTPYTWTKHEKALFISQIGQNELEQIFQNHSQNVLKWSQTLVGLYIDNFEERDIQEINFDSEKPIVSQLQNISLQNQFIALIKEEKLSNMLVSEIQESEYKWCIIEDEKAELVMELADLCFEDLIEDLINELGYY